MKDWAWIAWHVAVGLPAALVATVLPWWSIRRTSRLHRWKARAALKRINQRRQERNAV